MSFAPGMVALKPGEGRRVDAMGNVRINKAVGADTGGSWALVEVRVTGAGPPLHKHDREDEAFYVLQGRARVWVAMRSSRPRREASFSDPAESRTHLQGSQAAKSSCWS